MTEPPPLPILIVDDDEPTRKLLETLIVRSGFRCQIASNGQEAIDLLRGGRYAAVILDLMMPNIDGRDVITFLEQIGRQTPVIVCTAAGPSLTDGLEAGFVKAVVRKPFDIEQLLTVLRQVTGTP